MMAESPGGDVVLDALHAWMRSVERAADAGIIDPTSGRDEALGLMRRWYAGNDDERKAAFLLFSAGWIQALRAIRQATQDLGPGIGFFDGDGEDS